MSELLKDEEIRVYYLGGRITAVKNALRAQTIRTREYLKSLGWLPPKEAEKAVEEARKEGQEDVLILLENDYPHGLLFWPPPQPYERKQ